MANDTKLSHSTSIKPHQLHGLYKGNSKMNKALIAGAAALTVALGTPALAQTAGSPADLAAAQAQIDTLKQQLERLEAALQEQGQQLPWKLARQQTIQRAYLLAVLQVLRMSNQQCQYQNYC